MEKMTASNRTLITALYLNTGSQNRNGRKILFFFGHRNFMRNKTQTAVINMEIKREKFIYLTFRMFRHTSSEVTVRNRTNN